MSTIKKVLTDSGLSRVFDLIAGKYAEKTEVPTNVSELANDSNYLTQVGWDDVLEKPENFVTTDEVQDITGVKTFIGQKSLLFKQSANSDKLGFTFYDRNNGEKCYLELNPQNIIDGAPLLTLGNYADTQKGGKVTHVGFRKYSNIKNADGAYNLLAPLVADARGPFNLTTTYTNFYLPLGITNGSTMVVTNKTGVCDISSLLPTVPTNVSDLTNDAGFVNATTGVAADSNQLGGVAAADYATKNYVDTTVANLIDSAPTTLDTLSELSSALGDDPNFATTVATQIGTKLSSNSANYIKSLSISGDTITYTKGDDSTGTLTTQDTAYIHPDTAGNKHIPSGGSANQVLAYGGSSGTATWTECVEMTNEEITLAFEAALEP